MNNESARRLTPKKGIQCGTTFAISDVSQPGLCSGTYHGFHTHGYLIDNTGAVFLSCKGKRSVRPCKKKANEDK